MKRGGGKAREKEREGDVRERWKFLGPIETGLAARTIALERNG